LLYPGAFLLGNARACFVCGHEHDVGDHCISFRLAPELFEEVSATAARSHRFRFPSGILPATRALALPLVEGGTRARSGSPLAMEEWVIRLAEAVVAILAGGTRGFPPSPRRETGNG
jgi:AraC family transcriptional regulator